MRNDPVVEWLEGQKRQYRCCGDHGPANTIQELIDVWKERHPLDAEQAVVAREAPSEPEPQWISRDPLCERILVLEERMEARVADLDTNRRRDDLQDNRIEKIEEHIVDVLEAQAELGGWWLQAVEEERHLAIEELQHINAGIVNLIRRVENLEQKMQDDLQRLKRIAEGGSEC